MASDNAMASVLKRKRGLVGVHESSKRPKSAKENLDMTSILDGSKLGWDAAFGSVKKANEIVKVNGVHENDTNGDENLGSPEVEDFEEFVEEEQLKKFKKLRKGTGNWKISDPIGGRMLDLDPIFTTDERFLIVAHRRSIKVYSTSNSLLNRSINLKIDPSREHIVSIIAYALSPNDPNCIWVGCSDGRIFSVDWTTGKGYDTFWTISELGITTMTVATIESSGQKRDILFTVGEMNDSYKISVHELSRLGDSPSIQSRILYSSPQSIQIMKTAGKDPIIVAASEKSILIGAIRSSDFGTVDQMRYEFRVFESSEAISSLDMRISTRTSEKDVAFGRKKISKLEHKIVDLVVGDVKGAIFIHNDLLGNLVRSQLQLAQAKSAVSLIPRKLHWHRKTVPAAKWSLDGNYVISGGSETTLVLWQLDTGRSQFLPHLSAAIENIVVSPSGTSYALHLADNSTMILSTSELVPTANIAGLQAHVLERSNPIGSSVRRVKEAERARPLVPRTPAVINPAHPSRLIIAVGETQAINPRSTATFSTQYLQTFDIASNHNISRQALTRTNVTNINIAPSAYRISEPMVTHMQISHDGTWLATVDEWLPPKRDVESLCQAESSLEDEQNRRREVYLKFWQWQKADESWALVTRIDAPHAIADNSRGAGRVLGLTVDPRSLAFATIGEDGVALIWRPRTRKRDGVAIRGDNGELIFTWSCQQRVSMGSTELGDDATITLASPEHACLAFSDDGSILAAAVNGGDDHLIHLIDPFTGSIRLTRPIMYKGDLVSMAFLGQYLIILSDDLRVYDLVLDELRYGVELEDVKELLSLEQKSEMMHLAVDRTSQTFAVTLPCRDDWTVQERKLVASMSRVYSEVAVFSPEDATPLYTRALQGLVTAVVPAISSPGFVVLDTAAEVTSLSPKATQTLVSMAKPMVDLRLDLRNEESVEAVMNLADLVSNTEEMDVDETDDIVDAASPFEVPDDVNDDSPPVVAQQQLASIFDVGPAFALPPIEEMFYQVADLFSEKPKAQRS